jgi:hypothetical protein
VADTFVVAAVGRLAARRGYETPQFEEKGHEGSFIGPKDLREVQDRPPQGRRARDL